MEMEEKASKAKAKQIRPWGYNGLTGKCESKKAKGATVAEDK